jgi:hypothetical protein
VLQGSSAIVKWNGGSFLHLEGFAGNLVYSKLGDIHGSTQMHGHLNYISSSIFKLVGDNITSPKSGASDPVAE